jgi:hypothetical protein
MSKDEPKVTEGWALPSGDGSPGSYISSRAMWKIDRPAILMWREDYDAMRKELEELREWRKAVKGGYRGV